MTAVAEKPEIVNLPTFCSDGLKEEDLFGYLIQSGVHVNNQIHREIMDPASYLSKSITSEKEYHPVVIPVEYFVNQNISLCDDNKWYIPEDIIYRQAKELGLVTPPEELASLIAANPPSDHPELSDLRHLVIMSDPKDDAFQMTISLRNIPGQSNTNTYLESVWKNTFVGMKHIHLWKSGLVFIRK